LALCDVGWRFLEDDDVVSIEFFFKLWFVIFISFQLSVDELEQGRFCFKHFLFLTLDGYSMALNRFRLSKA
jgi:hypothetical protein